MSNMKYIRGIDYPKKQKSIKSRKESSENHGILLLQVRNGNERSEEFCGMTYKMGGFQQTVRTFQIPVTKPSRSA